jgi:hypothetical protein
MPNTICLIPSKDRALQLLALLESFEHCCIDFKDLNIVILYRATSNIHEEQYNELRNKYPKIQFQKERKIEEDVKSIVSSCEYIFFLIDDCICLKSFQLQDVVNILDRYKSSLGFSFRLGRNTTYCYPYGCNQKQPAFTEVEPNILQYDWTCSEFDFGYPMELSSSLYKSKDILALWKEKTPTLKHLENCLWSNCHDFQSTKPNLLCFPQSHVFSNPLNVTAELGRNRNSESSKYSTEALANQFSKGYKIDTEKFFSMIPHGCHQELEVSFIKR